MKAITWLASVSVGIATLSVSAFAAAPEGWLIDLDEALALAKKENKAVMVEFTGSDWCPPCMMMKKEVFSKPEFFSLASEDYVLVQIDVPRGDEELRKKNMPIAEKYAIRSYPSVVLLDVDGKEFTRFIATEHLSVDAFVAHLKKSLEKKEFD